MILGFKATNFGLWGRVLIAGSLGGAIGWEREASGKAAGVRTHTVVAMASALFAAISLLIVTTIPAGLDLEVGRTIGPDSSPTAPNALVAADNSRRTHLGRIAQPDLLRPISAIATGIGFLGAGVIFVNRGRDRVHGLTTAASIWMTSAVGLAAGFGFFVLAAGVTALTWFVLRWLAEYVEPEIRRPATTIASSAKKS